MKDPSASSGGRPPPPSDPPPNLKDDDDAPPPPPEDAPPDADDEVPPPPDGAPPDDGIPGPPDGAPPPPGCPAATFRRSAGSRGAPRRRGGHERRCSPRGQAWSLPTSKCIQGLEIRKKGQAAAKTKIDAYLRMTLGKHKKAPKKKTAVHKRSGSNPNFQNEVVSFDVLDPMEFVKDDDIVRRSNSGTKMRGATT